jgi:hypothetical protein
MTRLILTSSDSGAGNLLTTRIADIVVPLEFRLVWGAPPTDAELYAKLGPGSLDHFPQRRLREFHSQGMGTLDLCEHCDAIDLWFDPSPNAQLMLVQLLDCLKSCASVVPKLSLFQADVEIGNQSPETLSDWKLAGVKIRSDHLEVVLTALGKGVLAQTEDFSRHNLVHRWWGGTQLTNDNLWRWDASNCSLIAP